MKRPVEEVARALIEEEEKSQLRGAGPDDWKFYQPEARAVLARLVQLGFLNDLYFEAKKAEEASTVLPTGGTK